MKENKKIYGKRNLVLFRKCFGFTPLEKANGDLALPPTKTFNSVKNKFLNRIREQNSLTGFTLAELLVAVVILAITVLLAFHAFITVSTQRALAYNISAATNLAQDKLEEVKNSAYGSIGSGSENDINESGTTDPGTTEYPHPCIFDRAWIINTDAPIAGTKTITVTVTWPYLSGTQTVTLWTIKGQ